MDRNSAIGLTLIAVLLLIYFNFLAPQPPVETGAPVSQTVTPADSLAATESAVPIDTTVILSAPLQEEQLSRVETNDMVLTFTNKGGVLTEVELKKFKTYYKQPLLLVSSNSNGFRLNATIEGKDIDLYSLYYTVETITSGDSTIVTFTTNLGEGKQLKNIYRVPGSGYMVNYHLASSGLGAAINGDQLTYTWTDFIPPQEKDINDSRTKTTVNYYTEKGDFDGLSDTSTDPQSESLAEPIKWVGIRQKFFTSAIIAKGAFSGGEVRTSTNLADTTVVKTASVVLRIPKADVVGNKAAFTYFFGPNDYKVITKVTEGFDKNLNLGWPPVGWVNKYAIIPIFHFLEQFIGNYGVIIIILVIIIKLILAPLSYSSYLGMAKMRLLKPELDLIKEKNGDNMTQTQQDQMKLYQQAGVNPFSGCIPLLLQMPILFAMFYFFPVSVELRQQPFLWAEDLSTYDSIINLPFVVPFYGSHVSLFVLLMTASTLVYTWQNNQMTSVTGPMKSLSYIMPVVFMFVLNSFSAGLSFYYFVSNLVTFAQQAIIKRFVDEDKIKAVMEDHKKKMLSGGGSKSKFMTKLEEAMKASEEARRQSDEAKKKRK
ncbi:MAG: membrane protein insertase YidC [Cyclobacteriaceae bacterium]|nr:membrane protein insertase YidC [Cyclobacteriaceae bacterium]